MSSNEGMNKEVDKTANPTGESSRKIIIEKKSKKSSKNAPTKSDDSAKLDGLLTLVTSMKHDMGARMDKLEQDMAQPVFYDDASGAPMMAQPYLDDGQDYMSHVDSVDYNESDSEIESQASLALGLPDTQAQQSAQTVSQAAGTQATTSVEAVKSTPKPKGFAERFAVSGDVGSPANEDVASSVNYMLGEQLAADKLTETVGKYPRPENIARLKPAKVNPTIWGPMSAKAKSCDLRLQKVQGYLLKGLAALISTTTEITPVLEDCFALLCTANYELNSARKLQIKPELNPNYAHLCKQPTGVDFLFGDDLQKQVKDLNEERKAAQVCYRPKAKPYYAYGQHQNQTLKKKFHPYSRHNRPMQQPGYGYASNYGTQQYVQYPQQGPFLGQGVPQGKPRGPPRYQQGLPMPAKKAPPATATRPTQ